MNEESDFVLISCIDQLVLRKDQVYVIEKFKNGEDFCVEVMLFDVPFRYVCKYPSKEERDRDFIKILHELNIDTNYHVFSYLEKHVLQDRDILELFENKEKDYSFEIYMNGDCFAFNDGVEEIEFTRFEELKEKLKGKPNE